MNLQDYIKEAEGYLFQLTDISNTLVEAIADRSAWQANIKVAQENYDTVEAGLVFDLITGDGLAATGKNAEQRNAAKDAELTKWRNGCDEWSELQERLAIWNAIRNMSFMQEFVTRQISDIPRTAQQGEDSTDIPW